APPAITRPCRSRGSVPERLAQSEVRPALPQANNGQISSEASLNGPVAGTLPTRSQSIFRARTRLRLRAARRIRRHLFEIVNVHRPGVRVAPLDGALPD